MIRKKAGRSSGRQRSTSELYCQEILADSVLKSFSRRVLAENAHDDHIRKLKMARAQYLVSRKMDLEKRLAKIEEELATMLRAGME